MTASTGAWSPSGFLHYGIFHLALNMFMLYLLGSDLEPSLGRLRFGIVYFVSLLGGLVRRPAARARTRSPPGRRERSSA